MNVASGGLSVNNGITVSSAGLGITAGGATVTAGGAQVGSTRHRSCVSLDCDLLGSFIVLSHCAVC